MNREIYNRDSLSAKFICYFNSVFRVYAYFNPNICPISGILRKEILTAAELAAAKEHIYSRFEVDSDFSDL